MDDRLDAAIAHAKELAGYLRGQHEYAPNHPRRWSTYRTCYWVLVLPEAASGIYAVDMLLDKVADDDQAAVVGFQSLKEAKVYLETFAAAAFP